MREVVDTPVRVTEIQPGMLPTTDSCDRFIHDYQEWSRLNFPWLGTRVISQQQTKYTVVYSLVGEKIPQ